MRLIDADALLKHAGIFEVKACARGCGNSILNFAKAWLWNEVNIAPTIDAVHVVRCRECKHHRDKNEQERQYLVEDILICTSPDATDDCWNAVWPDHFCSYGERKEGAD